MMWGGEPEHRLKKMRLRWCDHVKGRDENSILSILMRGKGEGW